MVVLSSCCCALRQRSACIAAHHLCDARASAPRSSPSPAAQLARRDPVYRDSIRQVVSSQMAQFQSQAEPAALAEAMARVDPAIGEQMQRLLG